MTRNELVEDIRKALGLCNSTSCSGCVRQLRYVMKKIDLYVKDKEDAS